MKLAWEIESLPTLVQWELANVAGHYVIGLEPSTLLPDDSRFPTLQPGERKQLGLTIELLHGAAGDELLQGLEGTPTRTERR
jgi:hypothetical protein